MAISNATRLANFGTGIGTQGAVIQVDNANARLGIGTTNPNSTLTVGNIGASGTSIYVHGDGRVTGVLTATSFTGDGSNLTNVAYAGTATVPGINTQGHSVFNTIAASGITSVSATTDSTSTTTGALIVSGGVGIGKSLFVGGEVSVAGTITYNDVTNIDSVGIITAGKGFRATTGGLIITAGVSTFGADLVGKDGVQGIIVGTGLSVAGIITASQYKGDGSQLSGVGGDTDITSCLFI